MTLFVIPDGPFLGPTSFQDTFIDVNGTLLTAHTPDKGGPWLVVAGAASMRIESDKAVPGSGPGTPGNAVLVGGGDGVLEFDYSFPGAGTGIFASILSDATGDNCHRLRCDFGASQMKLENLVAGSATTLATGTGPADGLVHNYRLAIRSGLLSLAIDGQVVLTADVSSLPQSGGHILLVEESVTGTDVAISFVAWHPIA